MLDLLCWNLLLWNGWWLFPSSDMTFTSSLNKLKQIPKSWYKQPSFQVQVSQLIWQNFVFQANVVDFDLHVSQDKWQICFLLAKGSPLPFQVCKIFPLTIECAKRDLLDNKNCMILYRTKFPDASPPNNKSPSPPSPSRNEWLERDTWRARDNHDWSNMRTQSILLYLAINHYMNYAKEPTMGKEGNK